MSKKSFKEVVAMREENHNEFLKYAYENHGSSEIFASELKLFEKEKNQEGKFERVEKWLMLTMEEKDSIIKMISDKWESEKKEILDEGEYRYKCSLENPLIDKFDDSEIASIICMAIGDSKDIPNEKFFQKMCFIMKKARDKQFPIWKSFMFKGFVRLPDVMKMVKEFDEFKERSNARE